MATAVRDALGVVLDDLLRFRAPRVFVARHPAQRRLCALHRSERATHARTFGLLRGGRRMRNGRDSSPTSPTTSRPRRILRLHGLEVLRLHPSDGAIELLLCLFDARRVAVLIDDLAGFRGLHVGAARRSSASTGRKKRGGKKNQESTSHRFVGLRSWVSGVAAREALRRYEKRRKHRDLTLTRHGTWWPRERWSPRARVGTSRISRSSACVPS